MDVREYQTDDGRSPFGEWLNGLRDAQARQRIVARVFRLTLGNRGDWRAIGAGLFELRIDSGPGYHIYCGQEGLDLVLLLGAGNKRTQDTDIGLAHERWIDYQARRKQAL